MCTKNIKSYKVGMFVGSTAFRKLICQSAALALHLTPMLTQHNPI